MHERSFSVWASHRRRECQSQPYPFGAANMLVAFPGSAAQFSRRASLSFFGLLLRRSVCRTIRANSVRVAIAPRYRLSVGFSGHVRKLNLHFFQILISPLFPKVTAIVSACSSSSVTLRSACFGIMFRLAMLTGLGKGYRDIEPGCDENHS